MSKKADQKITPSLYVELTKQKSREVKQTKKDIERVIKDAEKMGKLSRMAHGFNRSAYAIAHCQITQDDPMRFFVTSNGGEIIINPKIVKHTRFKKPMTEACMSFPWAGSKQVRRWEKIWVEYQEINADAVDMEKMKVKKGEKELLFPMEMELKGILAQIFQHEIDHMEGKTIFKKGEGTKMLEAEKKRREALAELSDVDVDKIGRNDLCPCGSGKKFKKCHLPII